MQTRETEFSGKMTQAIPPFNAPSRLMIRDSWLSFWCKLHCMLWSPASLSNISGGGQLYPRCHTSIDSGRSASSMSRIDNKELVYLSHQKAFRTREMSPSNAPDQMVMAWMLQLMKCKQMLLWNWNPLLSQLSFCYQFMMTLTWLCSNASTNVSHHCPFFVMIQDNETAG